MKDYSLEDFTFDVKNVIIKSEEKDLLHATLSQGMAMRNKAKQLEDQGKEMKFKANVGLDWVFTELGIKKAKLEGFGSLSRISKERKSYDMDKLGDVLLRAGVDTKVINRAIKAGTKKSLSEYIEFRREKKK
ncbi:hypothetical protein LCGC14_2548230 [marine sediment metagenome]|uniref:Uncharacterized protein n=1 Tax=marine sediment metagenome TaxID=412755 RepID=A0A0F9DGV4_9ZZZZ